MSLAFALAPASASQIDWLVLGHGPWFESHDSNAFTSLPDPPPRQIPWLRILAEGAVIVVSILLAFGIEAWWDGQQDRDAERRILQTLETEFRENRARLSGVLAFHADVEAAAIAALELAAEPRLEVPTDSVDQLLLDLSWAEPTRWVTGAIEAAISSGELALIEDDALRARLAGWPQALSEVRLMEDVELAFQRQTWLPLLIEHSYLPQISNTIGSRPGSTERFDARVLPVLPSIADHTAILGEREVQNVLVVHQWNQQDLRLAYDEFAARLDDILARHRWRARLNGAEQACVAANYRARVRERLDLSARYRSHRRAGVPEQELWVAAARPKVGTPRGPPVAVPSARMARVRGKVTRSAAARTLRQALQKPVTSDLRTSAACS